MRGAPPGGGHRPAACYDAAVRGRTSSLLAVTLISLGLWALPVHAWLAVMDAQAIDEAIAIGQTSFERDRRQFHQRYRAIVARPPVDYIDVITPFRRVVIAAESQARQGSRRFGQRAAFAVLAEAPDQVTIRVELTFHPHHTFVGVPAYEVTLVSGSGSVTPLSIAREPRFVVRTDDTLPPLTQPGGLIRGPRAIVQPMLGGALVAVFDGRTLGQGRAYDAVVSEPGKELAKARFAFDALR